LFCVTFLAAGGASAQTMTSVVSQTETVVGSTDVAVVPPAGLNGQNGGNGYYTCSDMTWGEACARFGYSFPSATVQAPRNGGAAPSSGTVTLLNSSDTAVAQIADYDASSSAYAFLSSASTVVVTQAGYNSETSVLATVNPGVSDTDWVNGGAAFELSGEIDNGSDPATVFSVSFVETVDGLNQPTDGWTLAEVAAEFNAQSTTNSWGLTASVFDDGTDFYLKIIASSEGDDREVTVSVTGTATATLVGVGSGNPVTDLDFGGTLATGYVATSGTQIESYPWLYTVDGGPEQSSESPYIVIDGVSMTLIGAGSTEIGGTVENGTVPGGTAGNAGLAGTAITIGNAWDAVTLGGTAYTLTTTGGAAGQAGIGGTGGRGGAGGEGFTDTAPVIMFMPFPPLTIPNTQLLSAQAGIGGTGAIGGVGGIGAAGGIGGAIDFTLATPLLNAGQIVDATSIGGTGGQGGQGGSGGQGGDGGDGKASMESSSLLPAIAVASGNIGGIGGMGGTGGIGGAGGAGGEVDLNLSLGIATVDDGIAARSQGGAGGIGGTGGTGGQGGQGGDAVSFDPEILGKEGRDGFTGGLAGIGGVGGIGGIGGAGGPVLVTSETTQLTASGFGIFAESAGGQGGTGGQGGVGGTGGLGGNGASDREATFTSDIANAAGNGGAGALGGQAGRGGRGGDGGLVHVDNLGAGNRIDAGEVGIVARSLGGVGGTGGAGGIGGLGGTAGAVGYQSPVFLVLYGGTAGGAGNGGDGAGGGDGGDGGNGGNGGIVEVVNEGIVSVAATDDGSAIRAESLGGIGGLAGVGGGVGGGGSGSAAGSAFDACTLGEIPCLGYALGAGGQRGLLLEWNAGLDGAAGTVTGQAGEASLVGGAGGAADVENSGTLLTRGGRADGILAVSVGGVNGLNERFGAGTYNSNLLFWTGLPIGTQMGGAGNVDVASSGGIGTSGDRSAGMTGLSYASGQVSGDVTMLNDGGVIETTGTESHGIIARSHVATIVGFAASASGDVTVSNNDGSITVIGSGSSAVVARSDSAIGDAGAVTVDNADGSMLGFGGTGVFTVTAASISDVGDAGLVSLDNTAGSIVGHSNDGAVLLESRAATGFASGGVFVTSSGVVAATGAEAFGLRLISGSGDIDVANTGLLQGGSGGTAVAILGGTTNTLTNGGAGEIFTLGGLADVVITGGAASEAVTNQAGGWMLGSIDLDLDHADGTGNTIDNEAGATFVMGTRIDLGHATDASNLFTNAGVISIGLAGNPNGNLQLEPTVSVAAAQTEAFPPSLFAAFFATPAEFAPTLDGLQLTTVIGNFAQAGNGNAIADVAFDRNDQGVPGVDEMDRIFVTGTASLAGTLQLSPITGAGSAGTYLIPFLYAEGGVSDAGMTIHPTFLNGTSSTTATFTARVDFSDPNLAQLQYTIDYCPGGLTVNQGSYCSAVTRIQDYGWADYETVAANILRVVDLADLKTVYDSLDGEGMVGAAEAQHGATRQMGDSMHGMAAQAVDCALDPEKNPALRCDDGLRFWSSSAYGFEKAAGDGNSASYRGYDLSGSLGAIIARENAFVTLGLGTSAVDFKIRDRWMGGDGMGAWAGVGAGFVSDDGLYIEANLGAGMTESDYQRTAFGYTLDGELDPHTVGGDFRTALLHGGVKAGFQADLGPFGRVHLFGAYDASSTRREDFREDDGTWGNHYLADTVTDQYGTVGATLSNRFTLGGAIIVEPSVTAAWKEALVLDDRTIRARSLAADAYGFGWEAIGATPDYSRLELGLGLRLRTIDGLVWDVSATTWESEGLGRSSDVDMSLSFRF
jgi:hypothetical protein